MSIESSRRTGRSSSRQAGGEEIVGAVRTAGDGKRLVPYDSRRDELPLSGADRVADGSYVVAEVLERGGDGGRAGRRDRGERGRRGGGGAESVARWVETLGPPETPGVDTEVVLRHYRVPRHFPQPALSEAAELPADPSPGSFGRRRDLRSATLVTIDGEDAQDFDDALSAERTEDGWRLGVHIADVSHWVASESALDLEAERRGTSVYFPGRVVPMLPPELSDGLCSLRPGVPRLTLSAVLDVDRRGKVVRRRFAETLIESRRRLTYEEVRRVLEEPRAGDAEEYGEVLPLLEALYELMQVLHARRVARGSLDFDLPEGDVELDTDGTTVGVLPQRRTIAHRIVEEAMIAANEAVAATLVEADMPALYRVHAAPAEDDVEALREGLALLDIELPEGPLRPAGLARILAASEGRPDAPFISSLIMRSMKAAFYSPQCRGHFALASSRYTHFTSPIRRYPDLIVHRRLKRMMARARGKPARPLEALSGVADAASEAERRATRAERDVLQWKKVRFLADRVGEVFPGRITGVQSFGLFVQLDDYWVDGLVPIRTLGDEYFRFDEEAHRLVGEDSGRTLRLADPVEVELVGIATAHRGLDLVLTADSAGTDRRRSRSKRGAGRRGRRRSDRRR